MNDWYRVCVDGGAQNVHYTRDPNVTSDGHLEFEDAEGKYRIVSAGHAWTLTEVENVPRHLQESNRDGRETRVEQNMTIAGDGGEVIE